MKHTRIIFFYIIAALAAVYARTAQVLYLTEEGSGFFTAEGKNAAIALTVFIVLATAAACFVSFLSKRTPKKPPEYNNAIIIAYVLLALAFVFEGVFVTYATSAVLFVAATRVFAVVSAFCILLKAFGKHVKNGTEALKLTLVLPVVFLVFKTVSVFTVYASISVIAGNVFYLAFLAGATVFFLLLAKFENGVMPRRSSYALFPATVFVTVSAACCVIPFASALVLGQRDLLHEDPENFVLCIALAVFANVYTFTTYNRKNLLKRRQKTRKLEVEDTYTVLGNQFLYGDEMYAPNATESKPSDKTQDVAEPPADTDEPSPDTENE